MSNASLAMKFFNTVLTVEGRAFFVRASLTHGGKVKTLTIYPIVNGRVGKASPPCFRSQVIVDMVEATLAEAAKRYS